MLAQHRHHVVVTYQITPQRHECHDGLPGIVVGPADDGGLRDGLMRDQRRLHLGCGQPVTGDVDDVVHPADDPKIAIWILAGGVADHVDRWPETGEIGLNEPLVVTIEGTQHARPGCGDDEHTDAAVQRLSLLGVQLRGDPRQRVSCRARFGGGLPGDRRDHYPACLGLPPGVDDRAALTADHPVVPQPCLRIDRLTDRAENPQRRQIMTPRIQRAPFHAGPDRGWRGVENGDPVPLYQFPPDGPVRVVRSALVHDAGSGIG